MRIDQHPRLGIVVTDFENPTIRWAIPQTDLVLVKPDNTQEDYRQEFQGYIVDGRFFPDEKSVHSWLGSLTLGITRLHLKKCKQALIF